MSSEKIFPLQHSIGSGFSAASTAEEVISGISLKGKTAIVTGGYSGIGLETTRTLSNAGASVIVPARDKIKAANALKASPSVEIWPMDLADPYSVDAFAGRFVRSGRALHILINNAGIMATPLQRDAKGLESQFATNHLGHFQLTLRLKSPLEQANGARVVTLSSYGHRISPVVFEDIQFRKRSYDRFLAYGQSKTANVLFSLELDKRGASKNIRAFAVHPGTIVSTDLKKFISETDLKAMGVLDEQGRPVLDPSRQFKTVAQGAATTIWCATNPKLDGLGGLYCENVDVSPLVLPEKQAPGLSDPNRKPGVMPYAVDPVSAEKLWILSESLAGLTW